MNDLTADIHRVVSSEREQITLDDGSTIESNHDADCCEHHWLDFSEAARDGELIGLDLDLSGEWFRRVDGYGIELLPAMGDRHPVRVPGYGSNNGYYGSNIELILRRPTGERHIWDVSECQAKDSW